VGAAAGFYEGFYRVGDQLHRDRAQQEARDPRDQRDAALAQEAVDDAGEAHRDVEAQVDGDDRQAHRQVVGGTVGLLDEDHRRHDRARAGQERRAEGDEGDVHVRARGGLGLLAGQQLQGDQQEQQAARRLQRRQRDVEVVEDLLAEDGERHDDADRDQHRLPRGARPVARRHARRQAQEDRHGAQRVHDDEQGHERLAEQPPVDDLVHAGMLSDDPQTISR
jgi:hypothetical protein